MVRDNKDYEGRLAKQQLDKIETYAKKLNSVIHDQDELEEWVQEKLTLAVAYIADIKAYMDKELAKAGQTLHRDDIDDLLTQEYEAYQTLKKTHTPEAYERVGAIHERIKNYELEEKAKTGLSDFTVETQTDYRHIKAHDLKEAKKMAEDQVGKDTIKNKVVSVYRKGGGVEQETMWRVEPSTLEDDMKEARKYLGEETWKSMSRAERVKETKYLKFRGEIGFPGKEEDIETISAMQYYAQGGNIRYVDSKDRYNHSWGRIESAVGEFDIKTDNRWWYGTLYPISDFDKDYWKHLKLTPEERLFRYETPKTKIANMRPVVKINVERGIIYFIKDLYTDNDKNLDFEKRGTKLKLLQLLK